MFNMSFLSLLITLPILLLPPTLLHHLPSFLTAFLPSHGHIHGATTALSSPLFQTTSFLISHPSALTPLIAYAALGGLGQLFIFETIAHFGSLSLVMLTVTRKLVTMLLSVLVFGHQLRGGQWVGVAVVFAGIGLEAGMKRRGMFPFSPQFERPLLRSCPDAGASLLSVEILSKRIMEERQKSKLKNL
jgi:UDP-galactose transporter B1